MSEIDNVITIENALIWIGAVVVFGSAGFGVGFLFMKYVLGG